MYLDEFKKIALKNQRDFKKAYERIDNNDTSFIKKVTEKQTDIINNMGDIAFALKDFFKHQNIEVLLGLYDEGVVWKTLTSFRFVAFLVQSNLVNRVIKLKVYSDNVMKVRLYFAIMDYNYYVTNLKGAIV